MNEGKRGIMANSILIPSNSRGLGERVNEMSNVSPLISRFNLQKKSLIIWYRKMRYLHSTIWERISNPDFNYGVFATIGGR